MSLQTYQVPAGTSVHELEIKKSQFLTYIAHTPDIESAKAFITEIKQEHPGANHHCQAFIAGKPDNSQCLGFSDDGEPSGTAGKPMLAVLQGSGIGEITAVVVRYFGGIKLGTGGLVKAYASCVKEALAAITTVEQAVTVPVSITVDYNHQNMLYLLLEKFNVTDIQASYEQNVLVQCEIAEQDIATLTVQLRDATAGQGKLTSTITGES